MKALILAGGLGTRLASAVPDRPKILAPIGERTFLDILLQQLGEQSITKLVFLLGHRAEMVIERLRGTGAEWSIEAQPLGTAGAVKLAAQHCTEDFFLINGDTYLDFDARALMDAHRTTRAAVTLAAARVEDAGRYGSLDVQGDRVLRFREKAKGTGAGLINGGVSIVSPRVVEMIPSERAVSIESEIYPRLLAGDERITCVSQSGAFFDIGTPESWQDFARFIAEKKK